MDQQLVYYIVIVVVNYSAVFVILIFYDMAYTVHFCM